ncbi:hypothetical protein [Pseudomonas palleroniana]
MLAKIVNDNAFTLNERSAFEFFASKLAPTEGAGDANGTANEVLLCPFRKKPT